MANQIWEFIKNVKYGSVEIDFTGLKGRLKEVLRGLKKSVSQQIKVIAVPAASYAIEFVADEIYRDYYNRLTASSNPIVIDVLNALYGVCEDMKATPLKYFKTDIIGDGEAIEVSAVLFDLSLFNARTLKMRSQYYRAPGTAYGGRSGKRKYKIAGLNLAGTEHGRQSPSIGMGLIFEFGRTSTGVIKASKKSNQIISPIPAQTYLRATKRKIVRGDQRRALLVPSGGKYFMRDKSRWGKAKGLNVIYQQKNIIRSKYKKLFVSKMQEFIDNYSDKIIVRQA